MNNALIQGEFRSAAVACLTKRLQATLKSCGRDDASEVDALLVTQSRLQDNGLLLQRAVSPSCRICLSVASARGKLFKTPCLRCPVACSIVQSNCLSVRMSVCLYPACLHVCMSVCLSVCAFRCFGQCVWHCAWLLVHLPDGMSICMFVFVSVKP